MPTDRTTKGLLAVIAAALVTIAAQNTIAPAQASGGRDCGDALRPCYVTFDRTERLTVKVEAPISGLPVEVTNWPY